MGVTAEVLSVLKPMFSCKCRTVSALASIPLSSPQLPTLLGELTAAREEEEVP
jgi:hypothetical protein